MDRGRVGVRGGTYERGLVGWCFSPTTPVLYSSLTSPLVTSMFSSGQVRPTRVPSQYGELISANLKHYVGRDNHPAP